ncbi:MAG: cytochrome c [Candidatus Rokubacteria bacterium]|nr:cytochrome c [Candidatus Rokubacteria bacterium]
MRRGLMALVGGLALIGAFTGGLAWLLNDPKPSPNAFPAQRLYFAYCVQCHGVDGRGSWRAALFLIRPGNLADPGTRRASDQYLFDIIKHGGAPVGRPGMPAFGYHLSDEQIRALVAHVRTFASNR